MARCCKHCKMPIPEQGKKEYCSWICKHLDTVRCKFCNRKFMPKGNHTTNYCSTDCSKRDLNGIRAKGVKVYKCEQCNKRFKRYRNSREHEKIKFCSKKCASIYNGKKRIEESERYKLWLEGKQRCICCKFIKDLEGFSKDYSRFSGKAIQCKECDRQKAKQKGTNKGKYERIEELYQQGFKECACCERILPLEKFSKETKKKYGLSSDCKECYKVKRKDPERTRKRNERRRKQRQDPEWREKLKDWANMMEGRFGEEETPVGPIVTKEWIEYVEELETKLKDKNDNN